MRNITVVLRDRWCHYLTLEQMNLNIGEDGKKSEESEARQAVHFQGVHLQQT